MKYHLTHKNEQDRNKQVDQSIYSLLSRAERDTKIGISIFTEQTLITVTLFSFFATAVYLHCCLLIRNSGETGSIVFLAVYIHSCKHLSCACITISVGNFSVPEKMRLCPVRRIK